MKTDERIEILEQAEEKFLEAMRGGWAFGTKGVPVFGMSGYKDISYEKDGFSVLDRYCVSDAGSAGTTTIWHLNKPVWFMSYGGFYPKDAISFLKRALMQNYEKGIFFGGRGPHYYKETHYLQSYDNDVTNGSNFLRFKGEESIYVGMKFLGKHDYWGMALI